MYGFICDLVGKRCRCSLICKEAAKICIFVISNTHAPIPLLRLKCILIVKQSWEMIVHNIVKIL